MNSWLRVVPALLILLTGTACSHLFYYPDGYYHYPPEKFGLKPEEIQFSSKDDDGNKKTLFAWWFPANTKKGKPHRGSILQFHGNAQNISSHYLSQVWLTLEGFDLLTFDYQGYGKSEGEPDQERLYMDALSAFQVFLEKAPKKGMKIVFAESLGGAVASRALPDWSEKDQIDLLILDSTFASYKTIGRRKLAQYWTTWLFSPLAWFLVSDAYAPEDVLGKIQTPTLVIHDQKDPIVPFSCGEDVFRLLSSAKAKEFWKLDQGFHVGTFANKFPENRVKLMEWIKKLVPASRLQ